MSFQVLLGINRGKLIAKVLFKQYLRKLEWKNGKNSVFKKKRKENVKLGSSNLFLFVLTSNRLRCVCVCVRLCLCVC